MIRTGSILKNQVRAGRCMPGLKTGKKKKCFIKDITKHLKMGCDSQCLLSQLTLYKALEFIPILIIKRAVRSHDHIHHQVICVDLECGAE